MSFKVLSDDELKILLKKLKINVLTLDHAYGQSEKNIACITCNYVTNRCWLCEQCISCCQYTTNNIVD